MVRCNIRKELFPRLKGIFSLGKVPILKCNILVYLIYNTSRVRWGKMPMLGYQYPYELGSKVLLIQICPSVRPLISRYFKEEHHLLVAF